MPCFKDLLTILTLWFVMVLGAVFAQAADPAVSNVFVQQRNDGSKQVEISYDLFDSDNDSMFVTVNFSINDGQSWDFPVHGVSGDVGPGIVSGLGRMIIWDTTVFPTVFNFEHFRVTIIASDVGVRHQVHSPENVAILDFSAIDWSLQENIEKYSRADLCQVMAAPLWEGGTYGHLPVVSQLKALNPDLKIVGYVSAKSAQLSGAQQAPGSFWRDWFERTHDYWAYTTEGDTVQDWPGNVVLNILEPECRATMVETIVQHQRGGLNQLDGIFWDYFNLRLWIPEFIGLEGQPDLDGDGIAHGDDPDELLAFQAAQVSMIEAMRDSLGDDFLLILNGQRAYRDSNFAGLVDGMVYELFPSLDFPDPDMAHALDPDYEFSLFETRNWLRPANGGPYLIFSNPNNSLYFDHTGNWTVIKTGNQFRAVAMMVGGYSCWSTEGGNSFSYVYGWPNNEVSLGAPSGPVRFEDGFIRRDFEYGSVEIEMTSGVAPNAFNYRIWAEGLLIEELSIPFHHP